MQLITEYLVKRKMYRRLSQRNYAHNSIVDGNPSASTRNRLVNDQNGATGRLFKYGSFYAGWNACEAIAVHNAKVLNGIDSTLSETIKDFQAAGAMIGHGVFGSNPYAIGRVLKAEGIEYSKVRLNDITREGTYIISFWNDNAFWKGLHTVAVRCKGRAFIAYNLRGDGKPCPITLSAYSKSYICGYRIK